MNGQNKENRKLYGDGKKKRGELNYDN